MEKTTIHWLIGLYEGYLKRKSKLHIFDKSRWLGGIEAYLLELGVIPEGILLFDYRKETKRMFLGLIPYTSVESYEELILRLALTTIEVHKFSSKK